MNMFELQLIRVTKQKNPIRFSRATRFQHLHAHVSVVYVLINETELDLCLTNHIKRLFFCPFFSFFVCTYKDWIINSFTSGESILAYW
jgi:hypothetical protein